MKDPQQKDLITKRWRRYAPPQPSELQVQISVVAYARMMAKPDVVFWHCPNGELRDKRTAAKLKAMGTLPGVSDLIFVRRSPWSVDCMPAVLCLEIKASKGKQSDAQLAFEAAVKAAGCYYAIARDLDGAIGVLEHYGMVRPRQAAGRR